MSPWTRSTPKRSANACPLASELPRQAASREFGFWTIAGAMKSVATQPRPTRPQRIGDSVSCTDIPPSTCNPRVPSSLVSLSHFSHFLAETIPPLDEVLDGDPAQLLFPTHLHTHSVLRRIIRRIARTHTNDLANTPIATAHEWIGQRLGFLKGHHAFSITVSISLLQAGSHCTTDVDRKKKPLFTRPQLRRLPAPCSPQPPRIPVTGGHGRPQPSCAPPAGGGSCWAAGAAGGTDTNTEGCTGSAARARRWSYRR